MRMLLNFQIHMNLNTFFLFLLLQVQLSKLGCLGPVHRVDFFFSQGGASSFSLFLGGTVCFCGLLIVSPVSSSHTLISVSKHARQTQKTQRQTRMGSYSPSSVLPSNYLDSTQTGEGRHEHKCCQWLLHSHSFMYFNSCHSLLCSVYVFI